MDAAEPRQVEIDGVTYELRPWSYADTEKWGRRLLALAIENGGTNVGGIVAGINDTLWAEFCAAVRKYTFVIADEDGERKQYHLEKIAAQHLRGRLATVADLVKEHVLGEFVPFFVRALAGLSLLAGTPADGKS